MAEVTTPDAENIFKLLQSTRRNSDNAVELVNKLEGRSDVGFERNSQFYQAYVTILIQMYCDDYSEEIKSSLEDVYNISVQPENIAHGTSEDRIEFMLAGYGLLYGYDSIKKQYERIKNTTYRPKQQVRFFVRRSGTNPV